MMTLRCPALCIVFFLAFTTPVSSKDDCSAQTLFQCPNLDECPDSGFSWVDQCLDCPGYLSAYVDQHICFDRRLLSRDNPNPSYLYRDIVGIIVWFVTAGVAIASGVGGGGIFVPLGILLLAFNPKSSSGLSQASIFGASMGGLILNLPSKHPLTYKIVRQNGKSTTTDEQGENNEMVVDHVDSSINQDTLVDREIVLSDPTSANTPGSTETCQYFTRPLIDYDMGLFLAPMQMAGAVLGVLIQSILPNWLYLIIASVILGIIAYVTYGKWWDAKKKEAANAYSETVCGANHFAISPDKQHLLQQDHDGSLYGSFAPCSDKNFQGSSTLIEQLVTEVSSHRVELPHPNVQSTGDKSFIPAIASKGTDHTDDSSKSDDEPPPSEQLQEDRSVKSYAHMNEDKFARRNELLKRDARQYPADKFFVFCVLWAGLSILTIIMGGKGLDSIVGITCADPWYGVLAITQFLWTFGFAAFYGWKLMNDAEEKKAVGYPFHPSDVLWDFKKTRLYALFTFGAGVVAGLIGIGGGMLLGPLMLVMGIDPLVSTATNATLIVLTSSSVAILSVTSGLVPWEYTVCFGCTCFVGAYSGKIYIDRYIKTTGKASLLIFLLATIIAFATVGSMFIVFLHLSQANWCFAGFNQFCTVSTDEEEMTCVPVAAAKMLQDDVFFDVIEASL